MSEIKFLFMRRFNQDPLENFFGKVRSLNDNAFNPTPLIQFYFTFKKLFSIQYCNINTGNLENRDQILINFNEQSLFIIDKPVQTQVLITIIAI